MDGSSTGGDLSDLPTAGSCAVLAQFMPPNAGALPHNAGVVDRHTTPDVRHSQGARKEEHPGKHDDNQGGN